MSETAPAATGAAGTNKDGAGSRRDERDDCDRLSCHHELIPTQKEGTPTTT